MGGRRMQTPRNQTLAEALYRDIDKNDYLKEIYESLLYNYSINLFKLRKQQKEINIKDALRFADLLAKSTLPDKRDEHRLWGQELVILLSIVYPEDLVVKYYLGSVLSTVGNYRGLPNSRSSAAIAQSLQGFLPHPASAGCVAVPSFP